MSVQAATQNGGTMHARHIVLAVLAAAVTLTSIASAGPAAAKQRVAINMKVIPESTFALTPLRSGALKRDSGSITGSSNWKQIGCPDVVRDGQKVWMCSPVTWTLAGKRGTLTIRERNEWVDPGNDESACHIAFGKWKVVRGTGQYARITGGGRSAHEAHCHEWYARQEGFVSVP
jgi:hypothetical protein